MSELQDALNRVRYPTASQKYPVIAGEPLAVIVEAARLVADPDYATVERKDIDAATLAWATIASYVEIVGADDFADAVTAASLLHFFFEKVLPAALNPPGDTE